MSEDIFKKSDTTNWAPMDRERDEALGNI
jgi:hypothetical protein